MTRTDTLVPVRALLQAWAALARKGAGAARRSSRLRVFLDCDAWLDDRIRSEIDFVRYVGDRKNADVCISVTPDPPIGTAGHYRVRFVGAGRFRLIEASARLSLGRHLRTTGPRRSGAGEHRKRRASAVTPTHETLVLSR